MILFVKRNPGNKQKSSDKIYESFMNADYSSNSCFF